MTSKELSQGILRALSIILGVILLGYILWEVRSVIAYLFIAFALSLIGRPFMKLLTGRLRISNSIASIFTIVLFIFIGFLIIRFSVPLLQEQTRNLSLSNISVMISNIEEQIHELNTSLQTYGIKFMNPDKIQKSFSQLNLTSMTNYFGNVFSVLANTLIGVFSILFITFFFLKDKDLFNNIVVGLFPSKESSKVLSTLSQTKDLLSNYFLGLVLQSTVMFILYIIILSSFGINNAFIIALICAILNLVPYLGPLIGFIIFITLSMSSMYGEGLDMQAQIVPNLWYLTMGYIVAQFIDNFINQPLIYSNSVKSHPLEIFIVLLIFGILFGVSGVLFAVPGYTVLRVVLKNFFSDSEYVQRITKNL